MAIDTLPTRSPFAPPETEPEQQKLPPPEKRQLRVVDLRTGPT